MITFVVVHAMRHPINSDRIVKILFFTAAEYGNTKQIVIQVNIVKYTIQFIRNYGQIF